MRRRLLLGITAVVLLGVAVPADGSHIETLPVPWGLSGVSTSGRSVVIGVASGGCDGAPRVSQVDESASAVKLTVVMPQGVLDPGDGPLLCTSILKVDQLRV
jgi:hypothetical protein